MLDSFMNRGGTNKKQTDELQTLITQAKEERGALSAMLTQISVRSSKLAQMGKTLEQVGLKADSATASVEELDRKVAGLDERLRVFDGIEKRIEGMLAQVTDAQKVAEKLTAPDGDLQKHRQAVNQLASQALETHATVDTLRKERATLEEMRALLRQATTEVKQSVEGTSTVKSDLDGLRATSTQLTQEYQRIREASRSAREDAT